MAASVNRQILLKSRPQGAPGLGNFELTQAPMPEPGEGEVLMRIVYLSLDPYMRGRMSAAESYAKPADIGQPMLGGTVGEIVKSRNPKYSVGDIVLGYGGWQEYALSNGAGLRKLDPKVAPVSTALGVLGMPGMTAYVGLLEISQPKPGETVVVAAASGAVGSVVGQIAKIKGCRAVGIAGGGKKCRFVVDELGFDACIDHRAPDLAKQLEAACPKGIDVYFENVGGAVQQTVWPLLNDFARIPVCGLIAQYNATAAVPGPDMVSVLRKRLLLRGFIVWDFAARQGDFLRDVGEWVRNARLKYREDIVDGLENAPASFLGLLEGKNFGKMLVRMDDTHELLRQESWQGIGGASPLRGKA
jgi:NADPH-dependent curcumin reductase